MLNGKYHGNLVLYQILRKVFVVVVVVVVDVVVFFYQQKHKSIGRICCYRLSPQRTKIVDERL